MSHPARRATRAASLALAAGLALGACNDPSRGISGPTAEPSPLAATVAAAAHRMTGTARDLDPLVALAADARVVLLGEASHGTHEFYRSRAQLTQRLVTEHGFDAVVIEGDWPEAARVNAYVRGLGSDASPEQALAAFADFPRWMWRNAEVRDLVRWLRTHNDAQPAARDVGFYGMDVYGLFEAAAAVTQYLDGVDPAAARRVSAHYGCFDRHAGDPQRYGAAAAGGASCEAAAAAALADVERVLATRPTDPVAAEQRFVALGQARSVVNAEVYFRGLYEGGQSMWNVRDQAMAVTLDAIAAHVEATKGRPARIVVWAHNSHVGDARATQMGEGGELTVGQLMRQRHGRAALLVGQLTYTGQVLAASEWGQPGRVFTVRPALRESHAALFQETGIPSFLLVLRDAPTVAEPLAAPLLQRAIGVLYLPESERQSHYFQARLAQQYDAVLFFSVTRPVTPLS